MKLKNQVCSLELAKKLKELGVKQDSLFYWVKHWDLNKYEWDLFQEDKEDNVNEHISAFTVAELGEMLPKGYRSGNNDISPKKYCSGEDKINGTKIFWDNTEANARAKMLIYLIENKLIKLDEKEKANL